MLQRLSASFALCRNLQAFDILARLIFRDFFAREMSKD